MKITYLSAVAAIIVAISSVPTFAVEPPAATPSAEKSAPAPQGSNVRRKTEETVKAIKSYSIAKRDAAIKKAKEAMDDVDTRIEQLEQRVKVKKAEWSDRIAKQKEEELEEIKKARAELAERYDRLKKASKKAWDAAKDAFIRSFRKTEHKLDKVNSDTLASNEESHDDAAQTSSTGK